jgi:putative endopeptidase
MHIKGALTVGENIADLGGVTVELRRAATLLGRQARACTRSTAYTWQQRFFLGWAQVWRDNIRPEALRMRVERDPHSPAHFRINAVMGQFKPFAEAWCPDGQGPMLVPDSASAW